MLNITNFQNLASQGDLPQGMILRITRHELASARRGYTEAADTSVAVHRATHSEWGIKIAVMCGNSVID